MEPASLLVFADDWGRHPSSCQQLIGQLLARYPATWVNTVGMRRPSINWSTVRRGLEKFGHWSGRRHPATATDSLRVLNPAMWPWFTKPRDRWLNHKLMSRALLPAVRAMPRPIVGITTIPLVADLVGDLPVDRWMYYCVDDFTVWPGLDHGVIRQMEIDLLRKVDSVVAVSDALQEKIAALGRDATLVTHGVDLSSWQTGGQPALLPDLAHCPRPWVVFWGVIDRRMDVEFIRTLARSMTEGTVLLVGPTDDPDPALWKIERVVHVPPVPQAALPALAARAAVLVMPYRDTAVTRAIQPFKLKEYLVAERPVVVRSLPATRGWGDCLDLAETPEEFAQLVCRRLNDGVPAGQRCARQRVHRETWQAKAEQFDGILNVLMSEPLSRVKQMTKARYR